MASPNQFIMFSPSNEAPVPVMESANPFIMVSASNDFRPEGRSRKVIRSHVMRGKNRKPTSRKAPLGSWINGDHDITMRRRCQHSAQCAETPQPLTMIRGSKDRAASRSVCPITSAMGSDLSLVSFAVEMDHGAKDMIYRYFTSMKDVAYPVEQCLDYGIEEIPWFQLLAQDEAFVHSLLFVASSYFDILKRTEPGDQAALHMGKTIRSLQGNLAKESLATADTTLFVVLSLAMIADISGDVAAARKHATGLGQMIKLRGGIEALKYNPALQIKCCRIDISLALNCGDKPIFFSEGISWKQYLRPGKLPMATPLAALLDSPDERLVNVWRDFREFTQATNLAYQTGQKLDVRIYQEIMISVQYRLLYLRYKERDRHEVIRIAMLAFATALFLHISGVPMAYGHLSNQFKRALLSIKPKRTEQWLKMLLWLVFAAKISVVGTPENESLLQEQLTATTEALGLKSWSAAREILKDFLWVDIVNDDVGKAFFERRM